MNKSSTLLAICQLCKLDEDYKIGTPPNTAQRLRCSLHEVNGREAGGRAIDERAEDGGCVFHGADALITSQRPPLSGPTRRMRPVDFNSRSPFSTPETDSPVDETIRPVRRNGAARGGRARRHSISRHDSHRRTRSPTSAISAPELRSQLLPTLVCMWVS